MRAKARTGCKVYSPQVLSCVSALVDGVSVKKRRSMRIFLGLSVLIGAMTVQGCATVKVSLPKLPGSEKSAEVSQQSVTQRHALIAATAKLQNTPWPAASKVSAKEKMVGLLFGQGDNAKITQSQALETYLVSLRAAPVPRDAILADIDQTLQHARNVAEEGRLAATSYPPSMDDLGVLEEAIGDIRICREMYVNAMKELRADGHVTKQDIREVKSAFTQSIRDVGRTADLLADRADDSDRAVQYASPSSTDLDN